MSIIFNSLKLFLGLGLPMFLGYFIVKTFTYKKDPFNFLEKLALSYGIGMGVLSLLMFFLSLLKIRFTFLNITLSLLIILMLCLFVYIRSNNKDSNYKLQKKQNLHLSFIDKILVSIISIISLYVLFEALITPLVVWDSWAIYGFKAKAFYLDRGISIDFLKDATKSYMHPDYPLLLPLVEAWVYICLGSWNDQLVKVIFPFYFIGLIITFYYSLKYYIDKRPALLFTLFLVTIPQLFYLGSSGYADLPFTFYYFTSCIFIFRAYHNPDRKLLLISGIFAGLAAWTKNEGLAISLFNIFILFIIMLIQGKMNRRNFLLVIQYALIIFLINAPWFWFKSSLGLYNSVVNSNTLNMVNILNNLNRLPIILTWMVKNIVFFKSWNLLWLLSIVIILFNFKKIISVPLLYISLSLILYLGIWVLIYIITPYDINWHLATSLDRVFLHITPLFLFLNGIAILSIDIKTQGDR